jgi:glycosyltransferase involved in cell wall biosynthesis
MRVSIVTPSYNQARFLEETIRSVLDSHIPNLEYFVMDGASTDSSVEIIQKYEQRLTAWVSEKDKGQADAINKGLHQANGDIVAWLNSDDYYLPGAIELAIQTFEQHPEAGLVYGDVLSVDAESKPFNLQTFQAFSLVDLMSFRIISQPAVFIRRSVLEKAGYLDPSYHCLLDHHLWLRMSLLAPSVYIPKTLAAARYHAEAKNLARTADFGREAFRIVDWMQNHPDLSPIFARNKARIMGGANRFDAFYLLDGGEYAKALSAYGRAFRYNPTDVLKDWHRIIYAFLGEGARHAPVLKNLLKNFRGIYMRLRQLFKS